MAVTCAEKSGLPRPMHRIFLILDPVEKPKHLYENVKFAKWPASLKCSHFWAFEWNDNMRRARGALWSKDGFVAKAIKIKAEAVHMVDSPGVKAVVPRVKPSTTQEAWRRSE